MALVTAAEARAYIRGLTGTAEDATLDTIIGRVDGLFASWLGFPLSGGATGYATIEDRTYTHFLDGPSRPGELRLPVRPVVSITSIHDDPNLTYGSDDLVASADYTLYGDDGLVVLNETASHSWFSARRTIKIVYVAGFQTVPDVMKHAACLQAAHLFQHRDAIGRSDMRISAASASVKDLDLLPVVKQAIAPFRLTSSWVA